MKYLDQLFLRCVAIFGVLFVSATYGHAEPLEINIDAAAQVEGNRVFQHVPDSGNVWLRGAADLPDNWAKDRWEGVLEEYLSWFSMSSNSSKKKLWRVDEQGRYHFVPDPGTEERLRETLRAGLTPRIVMATSNIPDPLVEGGPAKGHYGYNVRQPSDYEAWQHYLETVFQYLADTFGRDEVRQWSFTFGIEADWQAKFIDPETGKPLSKDANRREYMRAFDYFHAALTNVLGPGVYNGLYGAFETQAPAYLEHWAEGENFATGEIGTRAAYFGFSDWYLLNHVEDYSPFDRAGEKERAKGGEPWSAMASIAAGYLWKYEYVSEHADRYPSLRGLEVSLPEHGYFDTRGGTKPDGKKGPVDYLPADYRGATLFALRSIAYAETPRLNWVNPRWLLGPDNFSSNPKEDVRPPRFHALRISSYMDFERVLPTEGYKDEPGGNEVRALATAADDGSGLFRLLLVNFNPDFTGGSEETVQVNWEGLPFDGPATLTAYRIDREHNNWWQDWIELREAEGIEYKHGGGKTHLGNTRVLDEKYHDNHLFVRATTDNPGYRRWLEKVPEYRTMDSLSPTSEKTVEVNQGRLSFEEKLTANSTLYLELKPENSFSTPVSLLPHAWLLRGDAQQDEDAIRLRPGESDDVSATLKLKNLQPNHPYTVTLSMDAPVRLLEFSAQWGAPGATPSTAYATYDRGERRLVLTALSNARGELELKVSAPAQPWEAGDEIVVQDVKLVP